jgi:hypothetical protein
MTTLELLATICMITIIIWAAVDVTYKVYLILDVQGRHRLIRSLHTRDNDINFN